MGKMFIQESTLISIADAIREKINATSKIKPKDMPDKIRSIKSELEEILIKPSDYPEYVRTEILRVAKEVCNVLKNDSFVSICLSDTHYPSLSAASLHALMGIKGLTYLIPVDFIAHLGDIGLEGDNAINTNYLSSNILEILNYMKEGSANSIPLFAAIGNHDCGNYITTGDKDDQLPAEWLYNHFTKLSDNGDSNTVLAGQSVGGYCYRDFQNKKIRVFLLNTAEGLITGGHFNDTATSMAQRAWFASKLQELNNKSDAMDWGFIVLCHYPADYGETRPLSNLLAAYIEGTSFTENGITYNFSGKNTANFVAQFHGHIHNYLYTKLYKGSAPIQYNAWRIGIPNSGDTRTNHNGTIGNINYAEEITQIKVPNTAEDTSFVVNVYNPSESKIYSFYYGKGYNRIVGIGKVTYYGITKNIANIEFSNDIISIESGEPYITTLTYPDNYLLETIKVTMGGIDITNEVYSNKTINIPKVTGNIVITAYAYKIPTTNLNRFAYEYVTNSTKIYNNGLGYMDNARLSGGAPVTWETTENATGYVFTGRIPWDKTTPIVIQGAELDVNDANCKFVLITQTLDIDWPIVSSSSNNSPYSDAFVITYEDEKTILTPKNWNQWATTNGYFAITLKGTGRDLVITCGGITEAQSFTVTNDLFKISSNNPAYTAIENTTYTAVLTPDEGYDISNVQVTMGGENILDAFNTATNTITINNVTGNIIITATGVPKNYNITNNLTLVTTNNTNSVITHGSSYTAILTATSGYKLSSVTVKMGNADITSIVYTNGEININSVTDDIVITAIAIEATYTITYNLTRASSSNTNTAISGNNYTTTLKANNNCIIDSVIIKMGENDITSTVYNSNTGVVNITTITGNIIITVEASIYNQIPFSTTTMNGSELFNPPYGYKTDTRIDSSGNDVAVAGMCCTGYIPLSGSSSKGDIIRIKNFTVNGTKTPYFIVYNANGTISGSSSADILTNGGSVNAFDTIIEDGVCTITLKVNNMHSCRLSVGNIDDSTIITVNRPIT